MGSNLKQNNTSLVKLWIGPALKSINYESVRTFSVFWPVCVFTSVSLWLSLAAVHFVMMGWIHQWDSERHWWMWLVTSPANDTNFFFAFVFPFFLILYPCCSRWISPPMNAGPPVILDPAPPKPKHKSSLIIPAMADSHIPPRPEDKQINYKL